MSKHSVEDELPRDAHVVHALRRELNRNTRQISQTFWQEFELIRRQQRTQLEEERRSRERITTLMNDTNLEAQQQVEALSRSISSHGINPAAPSPRMRREVPAITEKEEPSQERPGSSVHRPRRPPALSVQLPASSPHLPRAPPSSRATIVQSRTPIRSTPINSRIKLTDKPKK